MFAASDHVTVLKDRMQLAPPTYAHPGGYAEPLIAAIEAGASDQLRARIEEDVWLNRSIGPAGAPDQHGRFPDIAAAADIRRATGLEIDHLVSSARGPWIDLLGAVGVHRTGRPVETQPDYDAVLMTVLTDRTG